MIVMPGVDFNNYSGEIKEAAENCPTGIIKIEYTMKVAIWDIYVSGSNGKKMHFDIVVPEDLKEEKIVFSYGKDFLKEKQVKSMELSTRECRFCHIEEASEEIIKDIKAKGYHIIEIENCNE